jgi:hypothetical protein
LWSERLTRLRTQTDVTRNLEVLSPPFLSTPARQAKGAFPKEGLQRNYLPCGWLGIREFGAG